MGVDCLVVLRGVGVMVVWLVEFTWMDGMEGMGLGGGGLVGRTTIRDRPCGSALPLLRDVDDWGICVYGTTCLG